MSPDSEQGKVLSTMWRFGALVLVVSLTLAVTAAACRSSADSKESPSGWRDFVVVPNPEDSNAVNSITEMERTGGFAFVFPSYLPEGTNNKIVLSASEGPSMTINGVVNKAGPVEAVAIQRGRRDSPDIGIGEMTKPFSTGFPGVTSEAQHVTIAKTDVGCEAWPSQSNDPLNPILECDWLVGDRGFEVYFQWTVEQAIPGYVTEEMRHEAVKVVESMIVAPEHP
jgi:hypothetical protein